MLDDGLVLGAIRRQMKHYSELTLHFGFRFQLLRVFQDKGGEQYSRYPGFL